MFASPAGRVRVRRADERDPGADGVSDVFGAQVEANRQPVDLDGDVVLERDLEDSVEVERVLGPAVDVAPGGMAEAADVRVAERLEHAVGHLAGGHALAAVDAGLDPVELGEHVVGEVEPAVGQDVAFDAAQDAERRERRVGGGDLLGLTADVVGCESRDGADRGRVIADREVRVAAVAGRAAHLLHARAPVGPRRVAVEVAADVVELDQPRRRLAAAGLAQLGRPPRDAERAEDPCLVGRVGERAQGVDPGGRARGLDERGAEPLGRGDDELDRDALDREAHHAALLRGQQRHDLRQLDEPGQDGPRVGRGAHDGEVLALVPPAPRVPGHGGAEPRARSPRRARGRG